MGTVLCSASALILDVPKRSSNQAAIRSARALISVTSGFRNDDRGGPRALGHEVHFVWSERPGRRPGNVAAGEVVGAAVAVAPHPVLFFLEADDAVEVGAG